MKTRLQRLLAADRCAELLAVRSPHGCSVPAPIRQLLASAGLRREVLSS